MRLRAALLYPPQLAGQVVRTVPAIVWIFLQTGADDGIEGRGHERLKFRDRSRCVAEDGGNDADRCAAREGALTGDHFVEHRAESKDVGPRVCRPAFELFGRHVVQRANDRALARERHRSRGYSEFTFHGSRLRQTEIQELRSGLGQHHVLGLHVTVHDADTVRAIERGANLQRDRRGLRDGQRPARDASRECLSFEELHHQIRGVARRPTS